MADVRAAQARDVPAVVAIDPLGGVAGRADEIRTLRSEGWTPSGVLTGLDEGDPEHVFFHD